MHWLVKTIQRYRAEVLVFHDDDDELVTSKIYQLLESFPRNETERQIMKKNEHLGALVRMRCEGLGGGDSQLESKSTPQQQQSSLKPKTRVGVVEQVWTEETKSKSGENEYLVCFGQNDFRDDVPEHVLVNNWISTSFGATVHLHL